MFILQLKIIFGYLRFAPLLLYYRFSSNRILIEENIKFWSGQIGLKHYCFLHNLVQLLLFNKPFRNLFYLRCPGVPNIVRRLFCPHDTTFYLAEFEPNVFNEIVGGGLFVIHGFGTRIRAKKIGYGCKFRQLTTIGTKSENLPMEVPTIGQNVDFGANVCCFGDITIGNNVIVGAGSVVTKSIPDNAVVAGNPARIIKYRKDL